MLLWLLRLWNRSVRWRCSHMCTTFRFGSVQFGWQYFVRASFVCSIQTGRILSFFLNGSSGYHRYENMPALIFRMNSNFLPFEFRWTHTFSSKLIFVLRFNFWLTCDHFKWIEINGAAFASKMHLWLTFVYFEFELFFLSISWKFIAEQTNENS